MDIQTLYKLQELQREMDSILKGLKELADSSDLKKLRDEYQRLSEEYTQAEEKIKKNEFRWEQRHNELKNLEYNRKACEDIKFSRETDTVKKLESIEKQLEKLVEKQQEAEDAIIELEKDAENIDKGMIETKKRLVFIKKKYLSSKEAYEKSKDELKAQQAELAARIGSLMETVDTESMEMYNKLTKVHTDPVSIVENRKCTGCKMEVPSMDYEALKSGSQDVRCQSCGRLLYFIR